MLFVQFYDFVSFIGLTGNIFNEVSYLIREGMHYKEQYMLCPDNVHGGIRLVDNALGLRPHALSTKLMPPCTLSGQSMYYPLNN